MATPTSPTAGDGTLAPNQLSVNDYIQAGVPVPSGPSGNGNSNLGTPTACEFDALKAIMGNGCGKSGLGFNKSSALQAAVYSLVIFFISKRMFPKQTMAVITGSILLGLLSAKLVRNIRSQSKTQ